MVKQKEGPRGQRGIPGPAGPRGSAGPSGSAGSAGHQGPAGKTGRVGATGRSGVRGQKGAKGSTTRPSGGKARSRLVASVERHIENIYVELTAQMLRMTKLQGQVDELRAKFRKAI